MNKYFLYVGNAYPHKNLDRLMEAVKEVKTELYISSARNVFTERLQEKKNKYVKLLGFVPDVKLPSLYKNSIAFVYPSLMEGFGLPGIEALQAGTLLLASDIPVFREVYQDAGIYFDPIDVSSIASAMKKVLDMDDRERKRRIEYGEKFVRRYSWAKMAEETLVIYESFK